MVIAKFFDLGIQGANGYRVVPGEIFRPIMHHRVVVIRN